MARHTFLKDGREILTKIMGVFAISGEKIKVSMSLELISHFFDLDDIKILVALQYNNTLLTRQKKVGKAN